MQRLASRPRPAQVVEVVAGVFQTPADAIRTGHGTIEREVVAWQRCYESMARLGSIATVLRLRSPSRVPALIGACARDVCRSVSLTEIADLGRHSVRSPA